MGAKPDTWMPLYIADYLRKTMHLTRDQHGGYLLLIMACWDRGGRLPNDPSQLAGIAKASPAEWRKLAPVLMPFFDEDGEWLTQGRVVTEHAKAAQRSEARRAAGLQGGRPRKQTGKPEESKTESNQKPIGFADGKQNETPTHIARPSPLTGPNGPSSVSDETAAERLSDPPDDDLAELRAMPVDKAAWRLAVKVLTERGRKSADAAGKMVGRWVQKDGLKLADLWDIAEAAWRAETLDPASYMAKAAQAAIDRRGSALGIIDPSEKQQRYWAADWRDNPIQWRAWERGPPPGQPGCRIAPAILDEFGLAQEAAA